jgi:tetratricopeptide (TPR) repeat protein
MQPFLKIFIKMFSPTPMCNMNHNIHNQFDIDRQNGDRIATSTQLNSLKLRSRTSLVARYAKPLAVCFAVATIVSNINPARASDACYFNSALEWDSRGDYDKAISDYNRAISCCPDDAVDFNNRGYDWYKKGDVDHAIADYNQALAICPKYGAAYSNRGVIEANLGEYGKAKSDFYRALSADPDCAAAYENLGFQMATCPDPKYRDGKKAFENASQGYQLDYKADPYSSANALAAAYAECGDFAKAQTWQQKTIDFAPAKDKPMQSSRLELYKQHEPYRSKQKPSDSN